MNFRFSKRDLDRLTTLIGIVGMAAGVLTAQGIGDPRLLGSVSGICTGLTGYLIQKPADTHPTTEDLEKNDHV